MNLATRGGQTEDKANRYNRTKWKVEDEQAGAEMFESARLSSNEEDEREREAQERRQAGVENASKTGEDCRGKVVTTNPR
ncbi:hypothetical protein CMQ_6073 [Grosmannia clavigera kw1407]|uniref:Uncharacterized protein n=1 Tax=Grosmannia clavigera (strain kw1407 / UAMH 11150) TaxID=655863 RepID=F0XLY9_GROCL|nr:uncharacterized protein CMQ_6073 [Grosmannia clavigera kw1407]EFX01131.1 hypothetical protein CMQ_6073 [Grosmannia clavigera kw1407]